MLVRNIKEFKKKTNKKKIICLDCGKKKIGMAISDENHKISIPVETIIRDKNLNNQIKEIINEFQIGGILVGLPFNEKNKINKMSQSIIDITKNIDGFLEKFEIKLPILFWDENFTSLEAEDITKNIFKNKKKQKKSLDKFAAMVILEDFLNFKI
tara:strand:- start:49 stop:513 length:465 start_codon:yes stop_codon:yes gene_type:complete